MPTEPTKSQVLLTYTKLFVIYTVLGVGVLSIFMYFSTLARRDVAIASTNELTLRIGRTAYVYSHLDAAFVCGRYDPELAYIFRPGDCRMKETEYDVLIHTNSAGLRDDESSLDDPEVVILGDSHALGLGVAQDRIFAALIEKESGLMVLNTGMPSYGTAREIMLLRRLNIENIKYIIIQYCRNDFDENKAYFSVGGHLNTVSNEEYELISKVKTGRHKSFASPGIGVVVRVFRKIAETVSSFLHENGDQISEAEAFRNVLLKNMDLIKNKKIIILEINGHNKYDNLFISNAKEELRDLDLDLQFIDVSQFLTIDDYYILDNHMMARGHQKVAQAILQVINAQSAAGPASTD